MSNYVNREDIDRLIRMVNEIDIALKKQGVSNLSELLSRYYDQSDIDIPLNKLNTDLSELSNSLSELNDAIEDLDEDSGELSDELTQLKAKLKTSQGQLEVLNVDLGALSSTLDQLDEDLDGLGANLTTLDNQLNGEGGLSEKLETLDEQLDNIENTDIATIKQTIGDTTGLIGSIASNIAATNTSIGDVKTDLWGNGGSASNYKPNSVKANLSNVKTTVGDNNSGLVKQLNDVDEIIGDENTQGTVLGDIKTVQDDLGDVSQLSGTVADNIDTIQTSTIPDVKNSLTNLQEDVSPLLNSEEDKTIIYDGIPSVYEIKQINEYFGALVSNLKYCYDKENTKFLELVDGEWIDIQWDFQSENVLGVSTQIPTGRLSGLEPYLTIFCTTNKKYYEVYYDPQYDGLFGYYGEWRETTERPDFFGQTQLFDNLVKEFASQKEITETNEVISGMLSYQMRVIDPTSSSTSSNGFISNTTIGKNVMVIVMVTMGTKIIGTLPTSSLQMQVIEGDNTVRTLTYSSKDGTYYYFDYTTYVGGLHTFSIENSEISLMVEDDSDWVNLDFDGITDFTYYNDTSYNPEARKIGKQVYIRGAIKNNGSLTSTNAGLVMARLPDGFAPSKNIYTLQQGTNAFRYMLIITTSGELRVARYTNNTTTNGTISANSWLGIYCNFAID